MSTENSIKETFDQPGKLMLKTIALIKEDGRDGLELFRATGIPHHWINKLIKMEYKNPSVNRMEFMYEYLSGEQLIK